MATKFNAAFWKWFGDSKVVDAKGQPLKLYHGTCTDFEEFDFNKCGLGCHFGTAQQAQDRMASIYEDAEGPCSVWRAYLCVVRPLRVGDLGIWHPHKILRALREHRTSPLGKSGSQLLDGAWNNVFNRTRNNRQKFAMLRSAIELLGYDGVVYKNEIEGVGDEGEKDSWVVWRPEQIHILDVQPLEGAWKVAREADQNPPAAQKLRFRTKSAHGGVIMETKAFTLSGALVGEVLWWYDDRHKMLQIDYLCVRRKFRTPENSIALYKEMGRIAKQYGAKYITGDVTWKGALAAGIFALGEPEYVSDDINEYPWREVFKMLPDKSPEQSDCGVIDGGPHFFVRTKVR